MAFTPKDWKDLPDTTTPLSSSAMKDVEQRLSAYTDQEVEGAKEYSDANAIAHAAQVGGVHGMPTTGSLSNGQGLVWNGSQWVATDIATQAELAAVETGLDTRLDTLEGNWVSHTFQAGDLKASARAVPQTGWLLCDGSAVSRTVYSVLFGAIGVIYGSGDGSTTFTLPDLRGRTPIGVDGTAARIASNDALGNSGGAETHTLTEAQMPSHVHGPGTQNSYAMWRSGDAMNWPGGTNSVFAQFTSATTAATGGGAAHNNMPPYQVVNYFIKT